MNESTPILQACSLKEGEIILFIRGTIGDLSPSVKSHIYCPHHSQCLAVNLYNLMLIFETGMHLCDSPKLGKYGISAHSPIPIVHKQL